MSKKSQSQTLEEGPKAENTGEPRIGSVSDVESVVLEQPDKPIDLPAERNWESLQHENAALRVDALVREAEIEELKEKLSGAVAKAADLAAQLEGLRAKMRSAKRRGRMVAMFGGRKAA